MKPHQLELPLLQDVAPELSYAFDVTRIPGNMFSVAYTVSEQAFAIIWLTAEVDKVRGMKDSMHSLALLMLFTDKTRPWGDQFMVGPVHCQYLTDK